MTKHALRFVAMASTLDMSNVMMVTCSTVMGAVAIVNKSKVGYVKEALPRKRISAVIFVETA